MCGQQFLLWLARAGVFAVDINHNIKILRNTAALCAMYTRVCVRTCVRIFVLLCVLACVCFQVCLCAWMLLCVCVCRYRAAALQVGVMIQSHGGTSLAADLILSALASLQLCKLSDSDVYGDAADVMQRVCATIANSSTFSTGFGLVAPVSVQHGWKIAPSITWQYLHINVPELDAYLLLLLIAGPSLIVLFIFMYQPDVICSACSCCCKNRVKQRRSNS